MNRRELLKMLAAGGVMTASGLWMPGKVISIPSGKQFYGPSVFELVGNDIKYVGPEHQTVTVNEFYHWITKQFPRLMNHYPYDTMKPQMVSLRSGYRLDKPEHLVEGTLSQDKVKQGKRTHADREHWSSERDLSDDELVTDKVYLPDYYSSPRERRSEDENGLKGWR